MDAICRFNLARLEAASAESEFADHYLKHPQAPILQEQVDILGLIELPRYNHTVCILFWPAQPAKTMHEWRSKCEGWLKEQGKQPSLQLAKEIEHEEAKLEEADREQNNAAAGTEAGADADAQPAEAEATQPEATDMQLD